jgi:class 3 adenylate cyclase
MSTDEPARALWTRAGLYDADAATAADRLALLEFLAAQGFTLDEMVAADRGGRLFALAGDRLAGTGVPRHTVAGAAASLGVEPLLVNRIWQALGLPLLGEGPVLTDDDIAALEVQCRAAAFLGPDAVIGVCRVAGAGLARLAEAEATAMRIAVGDTDLGVSGSEATTALSWAAIAGLVPGIGLLLDVAHRHHIVSARRHFESVQVEPQAAALTIGVGFADLSGFTALSASTELESLSKLLTAFEAQASEVVHDAGGRVVKFLGDAVMFVAATPSDVARVALALVGDPRSAGASLSLRAGIAWGRALAQDGDYFGVPVNLAARLVAVAAPGEVLAAPELDLALRHANFRVDPAEAHLLRGIEGEVTPLRVLMPVRDTEVQGH